MKSCAIITEYNPFHNGHAYQLKEARRRSQADVMVVIMSGNFVQRGEPALIDKKVRTKLALENGADLVIELPWYGAIQAADYFGKVAVDLLQSLNIDTLCFGTEEQMDFDYMDFVFKEQAVKEKIEVLIKEVSVKKPNLSYPKRLDLVYQEIFGQKIDLTKPNHVLGLSYARANLAGEKPMKLLPLTRVGADHYDDVRETFASGTAIRKAVLNQDFVKIKNVIPKDTYQALKDEKLHTWDDYYDLLKLQIITKTPLDLAQIYQMTEGLEYKVIEVTKKSQTFEMWLEGLKSSRYTVARLQRLAAYILLNIKKEDIEKVWQISTLKVLGFNQVGRSFLREQATSKIVTTIRNQNQDLLLYEQRIDEIYHLKDEQKFFFAKEYKPIIIKDR